MNYWSFLGRFVLWSAALFAGWTAFAADWYVRLLLALGPYATALTGLATETEGAGRAARIFFVSGGTRIPYGLHLETASLGILPFLALISATATLPALRRLAAAALGVVIFLFFHLTLFVAYPFFLTRSGPVVDSLGAFWAILGYCAFPFLLWLVLIRWDPGIGGISARHQRKTPSDTPTSTRRGSAPPRTR